MEKPNKKTLNQQNASMRVGSSEIVEEEKSIDGGASRKNTASRFTTFEMLPTGQSKLPIPAKTPMNITTPFAPADSVSPSTKGKLGFSQGSGLSGNGDSEDDGEEGEED